MPAFPLPLGLGSFGGEDPETYYRLFKTLQGIGGYSDDDDSARCRELRAVATVAAIVAGSIKRASEQSWPQLATELLDEWEAVHGLTDNAVRNTQQRQERLQAVKGATSRGADLITAIETLEGGSVVVSVVQANNATYVAKDDAEPDALFQSIVLLGIPADYDKPHVRLAAEDVIARALPARALPARAYGDLDSNKPGDVLSPNSNARWNTDTLDKCALRQQDSTQRTHVRHPSRLKSYGPLSKLKSADLNAIQDALLWGLASDSDVMGNALAGGDAIVFDAAVTGLSTIDTGDWRDRLVIVAVRWSTTDVRPGAAGDTGFNAASTKVELIYTGPGGGLGSGYGITLEANLTLYVDTAGLLKIDNSTGSTQYVAGLIIATSDVGEY